VLQCGRMGGSAVEAGGPPGLRLVLGLPGVGKTGVIMRWLEECRASGPLLVVPTRPDVLAYGLELAQVSGPLFGAFPVCTFEELAARVAGTRPRALGPLGRSVLARRLLSGPGLRVLARLAGFPGTAGVLSTILDQLEEAAESPGEVRRRLECWAAACPEDAAMIRDLGLLLERRREALSALGAPGRVEMWRAAAGQAAVWRVPLAVHGFAGFASAERRLLLELARSVPIVVSLPYQEGRAATGALREEAETLRRVAVDVVEVPFTEGAGVPVWRRRLIEGFLTEPAVAPALAGPDSGSSDEPCGCSESRCEAGGEAEAGVTVARASGRRIEAELAAGEVARLLRNGFAPEDIVLVVGRVGRWRRLLAQVLGAAGIPFSLDAEVALGETGLGHALVESLAALGARDGRGLLSYLHSPYAGLSLSAVDLLEWAFHRVHGRDWDALASACRAAFPGALEELEGIFGEGSAAPISLEPSALCMLGRRMLTRAAQGGSLHSFELHEDAKALGVLAAAAEEMKFLTAMTPREDTAALPTERPDILGLLAGIPVHLGEDTGRAVVRVMSAHRSRTRPVRAVFVIGLVEGEFPETGDSSRLVSARRRLRAAQACGVEVLPVPDAAADALVFLQAVSRAGEYLYVSARDSEEDGSPAVASPFWEDVAALFPEARRLYRGLDQVVPGPEAVSGRREYLRSCALARLRPPNPEEELRLAAGPPWLRGSAGLGPEVTSERLADRREFTASELEEYNLCPFSWFVRSELKLEELEADFGPAGGGTLAHRVVAAVYAQLREESLLPLQVDTLSHALELADLHLGQESEGMSALGALEDRVAWAWLVRDRVRRLLEFDADSNSALVPVAWERGLRREMGDAALGGYLLKGRVDRMDEEPTGDGCLIIDYKSGAVPGGPTLAEQGRLQLPLYLLALREAEPGRRFVGAVYYSLKNGEAGGLVLDADAPKLGRWAPVSARVDATLFEEELEVCRSLADEAVSGIRRGVISATPRGGKCPSWCTLRPLCRGPERGRE
jgi:RecB family exonuclease